MRVGLFIHELGANRLSGEIRLVAVACVSRSMGLPLVILTRARRQGQTQAGGRWTFDLRLPDRPHGGGTPDQGHIPLQTALEHGEVVKRRQAGWRCEFVLDALEFRLDLGSFVFPEKALGFAQEHAEVRGKLLKADGQGRINKLGDGRKNYGVHGVWDE